jgi:hypothetical protein
MLVPHLIKQKQALKQIPVKNSHTTPARFYNLMNHSNTNKTPDQP